MIDTTLPNPALYGKVAVVMGGWSAERDVSLMSGQQVFEALVSSGVDAHAVDAGRDVASVLSKGGFNRAFLILHGRGGEDGQVQAALDLAGVPYTGSGVLGSALAMDKHRSKTICLGHGVPTADSEIVDSLAEAKNVAEEIGFPVVIKPTLEGSSIGVSMVNDMNAVESAYNEAAKHGPVMVERRLMGREVTAAILGNVCLPLVSMKGSGEFYDFTAKYLAEDTVYTCPAELSDALTKQIQDYALTAFEALDCHGWGRVDFMLDENDSPYFIECNTMPGMTGHSLVPIAARESGVSFETLCLQILSATLSAEELAA